MFAFAASLALRSSPSPRPPPAPTRRPRPRGRTRLAPAALGGAPRSESGDAGGGEEERLELTGRRGGRGYRGDELPFVVRVISPPPRTLGRFNLHPRTQCGDVIEIARRVGRGEGGDGMGDGEEGDAAEEEFFVAGDGEGDGGDGEGEGVRRVEAYVVKRVRNRFVWTREPGGTAGPRMSRKTLEIKSLARKSVESYLEKTLRES